MNDNNDFDFERFKAEAIQGMYAGKPLNGEKGIFARLLKHFLESALEGELDAHLQEEKALGAANRRNGKTTFFRFDAHIRKVIYTTNTVEGFHRQLRKVTKTKGAFTSDNALLKLVYMVVQRVAEKWTMPLNNWKLTLSQLYIMFEDRIKLHLQNA